MKGICKVCGCTEDHACLKDNGQPCSWVTSDLCDACCMIVEPRDGKPGIIIPKVCAFCDNLASWTWLEKDKEYWGCTMHRFNTVEKNHLFLWSGIWKPNNRVKAAQRKCPHWEVVPDVSKIHRRGRE